MKNKLIILILLINYLPSLCQKFQKPYDNFNAYFSQKNYSLASKSLDTLLDLEPKNNNWLINKVELEMANGNYAQANKYLQKTVDNGYCDLEHLKGKGKFLALKNTEDYKKIILNLEATLTTYKLPDGDQKMRIMVPPMMECYAIMLYLGNSNHTLISNKKNHPYFKEIDQYFAAFKNHPLILELAKRYPSSPEDWINNLRGHHNLRTLYVYDSLNIDSIKRFPIEINHDLAKLVRDFGLESNFMKFYDASSEFYLAMRKIIYTNYSFGSQIIPFFNKNFDLKINQFNVYFSPIYGGWQHGPTVRMDNYIESFYFGGIMYTNTKQFYYPTENLLFTLITEFDHTPINALTSDFMDQFGTMKEKLPMLNSNQKGGYYNLEATLNEYITWAFALQYFYENTPSEYQNLEKGIINNMEKGRGFTKFGAFMTFYKTYINERRKYPKMKDFYPEIVNWLNQIE